MIPAATADAAETVFFPQAMAAAILFPVLTLFLTNEYFICEGNYFIFSIILAILVCFNHRKNIERLMNGTENKISFKK